MQVSEEGVFLPAEVEKGHRGGGAGVDREAYLDAVPEMTQGAFDSGSPDNNPRKPTREELEDLFVRVYDGALAPDSRRRS